MFSQNVPAGFTKRNFKTLYQAFTKKQPTFRKSLFIYFSGAALTSCQNCKAIPRFSVCYPTLNRETRDIRQRLIMIKFLSPEMIVALMIIFYVVIAYAHIGVILV